MDKSFIPEKDIHLIRNGQVVFKGALLITDISGFTSITELLAKDGKEGTEELTALLNDYFEKMITIIDNFSGSIITFSGDSILARFSKEENALACAKKMLSTMDAFRNITILENNFTLKAKVIIGAGEWNEYIIGNNENAHLLLSGTLIRELARKEDIATADSLVHFKSTSKASTTPLINIQTEDTAFLSPGSARLAGEHRAVTAVFLNVNTKKTEHKVIEEFQQLYLDITEIVTNFGGHLHHIDDILGEGSKILILFGAPISHGDDILNSLQAMFEVFSTTKNKFNFEISCGIDTGFVFSGNIGNNKRKQYTVIGDSVNTAARLASNTKPGTINVSESIFNRTLNCFSFKELPPVSVKGKSKKLKRFLPTGTATTSFNSIPFVGRTEELKKMLKLISSQNKIILTGNAGIGKTAFLDKISDKLMSIDFTVIKAGKTKHGSTNEILSSLVKNICSIETDSNKEQVQKLLHKYLIGTNNTELISKEVFLTKMLFGIESKNALFDTLPPKLRHENLLEAITLLILELPSPTCLLIEDIHYASYEEQSFLQKIIEPTLKVSEKKLCFVISTRPERNNLLAEDQTISQFQLEGMRETESHKLLSNVAEGKKIDSEIQTILTLKAEGNPFFLVQFFLYLREKNLIILKNEQWIKSSSASLENLPESIFSMIMARIDSLAETTRESLKVASVVGVRFNEKLLGRIIERNVHKDLQESSYAGLTFVTKLRELEYIFSHMLIRDVAYDSILREQRRSIHREIGNILEVNSELSDENIASLAYHFENAEEWEKAIEYSMRAGELAEEEYKNREVIELYTAAVAIIQNEFPKEKELLAKCFLQLASVNERTGNYQKAEEFFTKVPAITKDFSKKADALLGIADILFTQGKLDNGMLMVNNLKQEKKQQGITDKAIDIRIAAFLAWTYCVTGELKKAKHEALAAVKFGEELTVGSKVKRAKKMGHALNTLATVHWAGGEYAEAKKLYETAIEIALKHHMKREVALTYGNIGLVLEKQGNFSDAAANMNKQLKIAKEIGDKLLILSAYGELCTVYALVGNLDKAIYCGSKQEKLALLIGAKHDSMLAYNHLAEIYKIADNKQEALRYANKALKLSRKFSYEREEAYALWITGTIKKGLDENKKIFELFARAKILSEKINSSPLLIEILFDTMHLYIEENNLEKATKTLKEANDLSQKIEDLTSKAKYNCYSAILLAAKGKIEQAEISFDKGDDELAKLDAKPARAYLNRVFALILSKQNYKNSNKYMNTAAVLFKIMDIHSMAKKCDNSIC